MNVVLRSISIAIFLISLVTLSAHSASLDSLQFSDLISLSRKPGGINEGGVYALKSNPEQKVYVKVPYSSSENNALILSYLTSRLLNLICPGQGPIIVPVIGGKTPMIASFDIPTFKHAGRDRGEHFVLLNLALDLMDITDRHGQNLGTGIVNGKRDAVIVDVDMSSSFNNSWFETSFDKSFKKQQLLSALAVISSFSDESIENVFYAGVNELEKEMFFFWPNLMFFWPNLKLHYPVDFMFRNVMLRKHQMEWTFKHFDSVWGIVHGNLKAARLKETDIQDDKYGLFLKTAAHDNNLEMFNALVAHGARDPEGLALRAAAKNNNLEMFNALLAHGVKDPYGRALVAAAGNNNLQMVNALLARAAKDPEGLALRAAADNNNLQMVNALLAHGAKDPDGWALVAAVNKKNLDMVSVLLAHGVKDPYGFALEAAVNNNNLEMFNALLAHGAKDPDGRALAAAVNKNNLEMLNALLAYGVKDPYGFALEAARRKKRHEMIKVLESKQK